jgi:hypothetical protein
MGEIVVIEKWSGTWSIRGSDKRSDVDAIDNLLDD